MHGVRKVSLSSKCFTCGRHGHYARDCHSDSSNGFPWRNRSDKRAVVEYGNNKRPYRCYKCNEQGHIAKECSMDIDTGACYNCRKPGHIQRNCPNGTSRASNWLTENVHQRLDDLKCYCCGGVGHISRVCPTAQRDMLGYFSLLKDSHMGVR
ncbi:CCHC-type zinc finger nucleic acid binding protein-like [Physella acuta]|uniref:CCHC-type zinc finger nucleic acid binding protein-like n=1 Tax=Physella acuta TaxID=109671 RepID=UPI0027DAC92D|nr:CCHC-type zinc finger nucleic acid binding protein-like [Physella acuta]